MIKRVTLGDGTVVDWSPTRVSWAVACTYSRARWEHEKRAPGLQKENLWSVNTYSEDAWNEIDQLQAVMLWPSRPTHNEYGEITP